MLVGKGAEEFGKRHEGAGGGAARNAAPSGTPQGYPRGASRGRHCRLHERLGIGSLAGISKPLGRREGWLQNPPLGPGYRCYQDCIRGGEPASKAPPLFPSLVRLIPSNQKGEKGRTVLV